jgi:hypothetical protein
MICQTRWGGAAIAPVTLNRFMEFSGGDAGHSSVTL